MKKVAVIGAGVCGMAAAKKLREAGCEVALYEAASKPGGLVRTFKIGDTRLECFYHHIFKTDSLVVGLVKEAGLENEMLWLPSRVGFYTDGKMWKFGGALDLLKFSPLPFLQRLRFGLSALYFKKKTTWRDLELTTVRDFTIKWCGETVWTKIWEPLLRRKFGPGYLDTTAAWLWGRIHPRANSREAGGEKLGYMKGSFQVFLDGFERLITELGVEKRFHQKVTAIEQNGSAWNVTASGETITYDSVIFTAPNDAFLETTKTVPVDEQVKQQLANVRYQAALCTVFELNRNLSDIYWLNISDPDIPFGGVIEQTNFAGPEYYGGRHVVYVFNYLHWDHPYVKMTKEDLIKEYLPALKRMFPFFEESMILKSYNFLDTYASPAYLGRHSENVPPHRLNVPGLYLASMTQIYPEDRNMNNAMLMGYRAAEALLADAS